jgi:hypothetical protein
MYPNSSNTSNPSQQKLTVNAHKHATSPAQGSPPMKNEPRMNSLPEDLKDLRRQLRKGSLQKAYGALLTYMMGLRTHFANKRGGPVVSGFYQGCLDMTYFALFPPALKRRGLKVAIVFNYHAFQFEAWLAARNRKLQRQYWELFRNRSWPTYRVVAPAQGVDSIIECDLAKDFDLADPAALTSKIENATAVFIDNITTFLAEEPR